MARSVLDSGECDERPGHRAASAWVDDDSNHYLKFDSFPIEEDNLFLLPQTLILQGPYIYFGENYALGTGSKSALVFGYARGDGIVPRCRLE